MKQAAHNPLKYTEIGGAPLNTIFTFVSSLMGIFVVIWCTYNNSSPNIITPWGQNHHYLRVRVLEQPAIILYTGRRLCILMTLIIQYTIWICMAHPNVQSIHPNNRVCQEEHTTEYKVDCNVTLMYVIGHIYLYNYI